MTEEYTEYEIRTAASGSNRSFHTAKFGFLGKRPEGPIPDIRKSFQPPIYLRYVESSSNGPKDQEITSDQAEQQNHQQRKDNNFQAGGSFKPFRRRRWRHDKEYVWELVDKSKSEQNCYVGTEDAASSSTTKESRSMMASSMGMNLQRLGRKSSNEVTNSQYAMLIPPADKSGCFRLINVSQMFNFSPHLKFNPLSLEETEEILHNKKNKQVSSILKKISAKEKEVADSTKRQTTEKTLDLREDDEDSKRTIGRRSKNSKKRLNKSHGGVEELIEMMEGP